MLLTSRDKHVVLCDMQPLMESCSFYNKVSGIGEVGVNNAYDGQI